MQIHDRSIRGLDLHLQRLRDARDAMFGRHLPDAQIVDYLRLALNATPEDASLAFFITSSPGEFVAPRAEVHLDVVTRITDAATGPLGPLALDVVAHERDLPDAKMSVVIPLGGAPRWPAVDGGRRSCLARI